MKNHAPIKRHQALVSFSRDHHFGLLLVWKIRQGLANAIEPARISDYVLYSFKEYLQPHFKDEEQMLFPRLAADNALRQQAEKEHEMIYDMIKQLGVDRTNEALLLKFAEALKDHIRFEERDLFGLLERTLSAAALDEIIAHHESMIKEPEPAWHDVFWLAENPACKVNRS